LRGAEIVAQRLVSGMAEMPVVTSAGPIPVTISVGGSEAAQILTSDLNCTRLIEIADQCLYASKRDGRNRYTMSLDGSSPLAFSSSASSAQDQAHQR
jgi:GGDEF domain-containing protein